jgi:two-component system, OmpR family, KDP operon response regulator KdpE
MLEIDPRTVNVLIVDDERALCDIWMDALRSVQYQCQSAYSLGAARAYLASHPVDVVLLDLGLPDGEGFDLLREIRKRDSMMGLIVVSGRNKQETRDDAIDAGADVYLTKPVEVAEIRRAVLSAARRARQIREKEVITIGDLRIEFESRRVTRGSEVIPLTALEYDLVAYLARHSTEVVSADTLLKEVWGDAEPTDHQKVHVRVARLREKLEGAGRPRVLHTRWGNGYQLAASSSSDMSSGGPGGGPGMGAPPGTPSGTPMVM